MLLLHMHPNIVGEQLHAILYDQDHTDMFSIFCYSLMNLFGQRKILNKSII